MCHPKPGPRCSPHAYKAYMEASTSLRNFDVRTGSPDEYVRLREAEEKAKFQYHMTPQGQKDLQAAIDAGEDNDGFMAIRKKKAAEERKNALALLKASKQSTNQSVTTSKRSSGGSSGPKPPKMISLFRNGSLEPSKYTGEVAEIADKADAVRPAGHPPRHGSLYATVDVASVGRWASANWSVFGSRDEIDKTTREIRVNPENLYVYSVHAWESVSWDGKDPSNYWDSAIPLSDWARVSKERGLKAEEWEVLVPAEAVASAKPCSDDRLLNAQPEDSFLRRQLMSSLPGLRNRARRKGRVPRPKRKS